MGWLAPISGPNPERSFWLRGYAHALEAANCGPHSLLDRQSREYRTADEPFEPVVTEQQLQVIGGRDRTAEGQAGHIRPHAANSLGRFIQLSNPAVDPVSPLDDVVKLARQSQRHDQTIKWNRGEARFATAGSAATNPRTFIPRAWASTSKAISASIVLPHSS